MSFFRTFQLRALADCLVELERGADVEHHARRLEHEISTGRPAIWTTA